jgi:hypothetical protein
LQEAANQARRSAASNPQDGGSQAAATAQQLQEAQRRLQSAMGNAGNPQQAVQDAQRKAQELVQEQKSVQSQAQNLPQQGAARDEQVKALGERKDAMEAKVSELQKQLTTTAGQMRNGEQRDAANKLREAADGIRNDQVQEKIRYSKGALAGNQEFSRGYEQEIANNLKELQETIGQASEAMSRGMRQNAQTQALDKARNLLRGMESLSDRMQQGQQGQQGQGQQGQQGEPGKGQQGQQGEPGKGQQGEPGKGQQGQQGEPGKGQQGQQGQGQQGQQGQGQQGQGQGQGQQGQPGQGQQGQQGRGQQGDRTGQQMGDGRTQQGEGFQRGMATSGGGGVDSRNVGQYSAEAIRQFRREIAERTLDAQALRQALQQAGVPTKDLEEVVRQLRQLDSETAFKDPLGVQELTNAALETLKKFEFDLRKKLDKSSNALFLNGNEEIPANFRNLIEEYYKSLAKKGGGKD